jgi:hypothetical protein
MKTVLKAIACCLSMLVTAHAAGLDAAVQANSRSLEVAVGDGLVRASHDAERRGGTY